MDDRGPSLIHCLHFGLGQQTLITTHQVLKYYIVGQHGLYIVACLLVGNGFYPHFNRNTVSGLVAPAIHSMGARVVSSERKNAIALIAIQ